MKVAANAGGLDHFVNFLWPIWRDLPDDLRGEFYARGRAAQRAKDLGIPVLAMAPPRKQLRDMVIMTASQEDARACREAKVILVNHGIGMRYTGEEAHPSYSGGDGRENVVLHLCPSEQDARVCRSTGAQAVAIGPPPYLDEFIGQPKERSEPPVVVVSFHSDVHVVSETRSALHHYKDALIDLARRQDRLPFRLLGHGHPRWGEYMRKFWTRVGVPYEPDWLKVLRQVDCYVVDNSSTLYEISALDRPTVTLSAPWYRRDVHHNFRFWSHIPGVHVKDPECLERGILMALEDRPQERMMRREAVDTVYGENLIDGQATRRAVDAVVDFLETHAA